MHGRGRTLAPAVGAIACLVVAATVAIPYLVADQVTRVSAYYGAGAITPLAAGLLALVGVIVFAAGREGRTDPGLAAGVTLVLGAVSFLVALLWALTLPGDLVVGTEKSVLWTVHRWVVVLASGVMAASAGWYARSLGLV